MSDIKTVIALLCKHLNLSLGIALKPEHFRLAKYDKKTDNTIDELWAVLYLLSTCAVKETQDDVTFHDYDRITSVKLNFAFLQYPHAEFYALPSNDSCNSRELLVALSWLMATQNILWLVVKMKTASSILGEEFSNTELSKATNAADHVQSSSTKAQINDVIHTCGRISHNLKIISELVTEKVKLTTKVHAASISTSGLPHLSVSEMALTKRFAMNNKQSSIKDNQRMHELHTLATMLDTHSKWTKKQHVFFEWMTTVIEEHKRSHTQKLTEVNLCELLKFVCLMRHIVKKNLNHFKHPKAANDNPSSKSECVSRLLRIQESNTEAEIWLQEAQNQLQQTEGIAEKKYEQLAADLKTMLKCIPNCVQV